MRPGAWSVTVIGVLLAGGCRQDMHDQPKYKPLRESDFFADKRASRPLVAGTVARGSLREDALLYTGKLESGMPTAELPMPVTSELLARGREQFQTYCTPCHGRTGAGDGMIVQRGFKRPSSFHINRLRMMPVGYLYDVITNGFGAMSDYSAQVTVKDRWAIAAYVRVLQLSQYAPVDVVPAAERATLESAPLAPEGSGPAGHEPAAH
jgi:mono/diheme cytochrome c family protein